MRLDTIFYVGYYVPTNCSLYLQVERYSSGNSATTSENIDTDAEFVPTTSSERYFATKRELDNLMCDLGLKKPGAEPETSRLNESTLFGDVCTSTAYQNRCREFSVYFDVIEDLFY